MEQKQLKQTVGRLADILMFAILLIQIFYVFIGNTLHELLGIAFFVCLTVHIVLKRSWFRSLCGFAKKSAQNRFFDIVTVLLIVCIVLMMLSSMGVSRLLFPWFRLLGSAALHRYLAAAVLALSVIHGGMHMLRRTQKKKRTALLIAAGAAASVALVLALVPYLNRHFKTVRINRSNAVSGDAVQWNGQKPLTVYFTRLGNTAFDDDADAVSGASLLLADGERMGNTQLLAEMIQNATGCDTAAITLTGTLYPSSYGDTVSVAGKELKEQARPAIQPIDTSAYDSVILVYPIWWGTIPMPVASFLEQSDLCGKKLYLVATQGSSGFVQSTQDIRKLLPETVVTEGVSIYCEDIPYVREQLCDWLKTVAQNP